MVAGLTGGRTVRKGVGPVSPFRRGRPGRTLVALAVALALVQLTQASAAAFHRHPKSQCGFHWKKSLAKREKVLRCWGNKRDVGPWKTLKVGRCESGADLLDNFLGDGLGGTFQHVVSAWPRRAAKYGAEGYGIRNVWAQAKVSTGMTKGDAAGWKGHWPTCAP